MSDFVGLYNIRDAVDSDKNFVMASFLNGLYYGDSWFSEIPKDIFMDNYKKVIQFLVDSPTVAIKIACLPEDPNVIIGYSLLSSDYMTIHWVYVKKNWRKKGIAKSLLPSNSDTVTHLSELGRILMKKYKNMIFNPFKLN